MAFVLGVTGSFGSGKSTVSAMLRRKGACVIDADQLSRAVLEPGQPALAELAQAFGSDLIGPDGALDRPELARRAFCDRVQTARLGSIVHPYVRQLELEQMERFKDAPLIVLDVPLLYEARMQDLTRAVVVVAISERERFGRLARLRGFGEQEVIRRLGMQMAQSRKIERADAVVDNSGDLSSTQIQLERILEKLGLAPVL